MIRDYFVLNEFLVPRLLLLSLLGRKPAVLSIWPLLPASRGLLSRLVRMLEARGRLADPFAARPSWERFQEKQGGVESYGFYTDAYMRIEPVQNRYFDFDGIARRLPDYGQAIKHRIATHYPDLLWLILALRDLGPEETVHGLPEEMRLYAAEYAGAGKPPAYRTPSVLQAALPINTLCWLMATLYSLVWVCRHIVLKSPVRKRYQLGADLLQVFRHLYVTREMVDDDSQCLVVFRTPQFQQMYRDKIGDIEHCLVTDGVVPLRLLPSFLAVVFGHHARLFSLCRNYSPSLYRRIATLAHWRIVYRALLQRHDLERFLARDDYNADHVIRTDELRRAGVMSIGIGHGLPTQLLISPVFRYLDFDYYLTFTSEFFETHYRTSFTPQTQIVGIGTIGLTREGFARLGDPRPDDILVYLSHDLESERYMEALHDIARRFPERKFLCKIKESQFGHGTAQFFLDAIDAGPDNLIETREDSYLLMLSGRYGISNDSTVIAEAIGLGVYCFMYDVYDELAPEDGHPCMYRNHPEICVDSAEVFEQRIRGIEDGSWHYPRERMTDLIELDGINPFDKIRSVIGLEPKEPLEPMKIMPD
jgi:hypothetical protein